MAVSIQLSATHHSVQPKSEMGETIFQQATDLVIGFEYNKFTADEAIALSSVLIAELSSLRQEQPPDIQAIRETLGVLIRLQVSDMPQQAATQLSSLLNVETLQYDLTYSQAVSLFTLERCVSKVIENTLGLKGENEELLLLLLGIYEDILEHLWLLPYLSNDPEVHKVIVQEGVPPLLHRSDRMMGLLQKIQHQSPRVQSTYRSITMAYNRLETPMAPRFIEKVQQITPQSNSPFFLGKLAELYRDMQDYHRAIYYYERALSLTEGLEQGGLKVSELKGALYSNLGNAHQALGDYPQAIEYHEKDLAIALALGDRAGEGRAYANLGIAHDSLGDYPQAIEYYEKHLAIAKALGDRAGEGKSYGNLGNTHRLLGDYPQAIENHEKCLSIALTLGDRAGEGGAYIGLGNAHYSLGDYPLAIEYHEKHLAIALALGDRAGEGKAYGNLGNAHHSLGDYFLAIENHEKHLAIALALGDRAGEGGAYGNLGNAHQSLGDYPQAIEYHEKRLTIALALGDRAGEGRSYGNLGIVHQSLGDYPQAIEYHEKHLAIAQTLGDREGEGNAYSGLGNAHGSRSDYPQAIEYHEKHLAIAKALGDRAGEGKSYGNLGNAHRLLGDYPQAIENHEKCLSIALTLGDRAGEGRAYSGLGNAHYSLGNYPQAIEYHEKHLAIALALGDRAGEGKAYGNLGNAHHSHGDYLLAFECHEKDLPIALALGDRAGVGRAYANLGITHQSLGNYPQAIECHEKALAIALALGDRAGEGGSYGNLGNAHQSLGDYPQAIEYHEKDLSIALALGDRAGEGGAYGNLGNAHNSLGDYPQAIEYHEKHLSIALALGDRAGEGGAYGNLGNAHDSLGKTTEAIEYFEKLLAIAEELGESDHIGVAQGNLGVAYVKLEDYVKAKEHYREGIRAFSHIQYSLKEMYHAKITIFEEQSKAYFGLEHSLLLQRKYTDALIISDSRRSRTLINRIQAKRGVHAGSMLVPIQIEEIEELAEKLSTTFVVYASNPHEEADQVLGTWIIHPGQVVYRSIEIPSIYRAISERAITPFHNMGFPRSRAGEGIEGLFADLPNSDLVMEAEKEQIAFLQNWYKELIAPIIDVLPTEDDTRITLVPDGLLMDLPFALLMDPEEKYLFEKYTISIIPSIKTLYILTQREASPSEKNLIVGNPKAPTMPPLPFSTKEAKKVAEVTGTLPKHTLVEGEALKTTVLAQLENSRFIHLACHGFPKAKGKHSIYDGAFYLTPDKEDPEGILYAEEIVARDLNAELVMLSACHSGKGRQQQEGVIGPVRSFIAAGAQSVVATLWALPDSELTIKMVSQFYEHILGSSAVAQAEGRPLDKDEALREVMRMAASGPERNHPQKWGAFFMTGALQPRS